MTINNGSDEQFLAKIKRSLDQQASDLDSVTLSRLHEVRAHALKSLTTQTHKPVQKYINRNYLWASSFAAIVTLTVTITLLWPKQDEVLPIFLQEEVIDVALLADNNSIEFYEELDFYIWLEQKELEVNEVS